MATQTFTAADRKSIALGWAGSALSQIEYAARHKISPRTLRQWCSRYAPQGVPSAAVRSVLVDFIERAQALLAALDGQAHQPVQLSKPDSAADSLSCMPVQLSFEELPSSKESDKEPDRPQASEKWSWD